MKVRSINIYKKIIQKNIEEVDNYYRISLVV